MSPSAATHESGLWSKWNPPAFDCTQCALHSIWERICDATSAFPVLISFPLFRRRRPPPPSFAHLKISLCSKYVDVNKGWPALHLIGTARLLFQRRLETKILLYALHPIFAKTLHGICGNESLRCGMPFLIHSSLSFFTPVFNLTLFTRIMLPTSSRRTRLSILDVILIIVSEPCRRALY